MTKERPAKRGKGALRAFAAGLTACCLAGWPTANGADGTAKTEPVISAADLRADFAALYDGLKSAHYDLYAHQSKDEYDALFKKTTAALEAPLTLFEAQVAFQQFVAFGNVAHARIDLPRDGYDAFRNRGGRVFPIYPRIVEGRFYVGESYAANGAVAAGDEVLTINGSPAQDWIARASRYVSADTPYMAHSLLEFRFPFLVWLALGEVGDFALEVRSPAARPRAIRIAGASLEDENAAAPEARGFVLDGDARAARMLDADIAYLKPGPFFNAYSFDDPAAMWDNRAFIAFIDDAFESFIAAGATRLLIDLRDNAGGDNSFSDPMVAWIADRPFRFISSFRVKSSPQAEAANAARIEAAGGAAAGPSAMFAEQYAKTPYGEVFTIDLPETPPRAGRRFDGDVYVLINRHSYSNAVNVAAIIQDYGFGRIMGEKTSDLATTYGAMETFRLPRTGIEVGFPKAHLIRPSGDEKTDGVTPDIAIPSPIGQAPEDDVLNAAVEMMRE